MRPDCTFYHLLSRAALSVLLMLLTLSVAQAQYPPSHDPSTMVQNVDGRYWIFTTGDGVWAMSSSNRDFTNWRPEPTPFPIGQWPSWINNYVDGFRGFFWAPDVIKIGSTYFLYYSCAGNGAPAAIGVATATNLAGPWTDRGMVVAGNNAIDPALLLDNGRLYMSWGNWQSGIDIIELSTSTGKPIGGSTHLVDGNVEGPGLIKNGSYYYLFYQRGLCCNGVNSSYYMVVARSTNIRGPYTGERVFLPNRSGNEVGPGHFGYSFSRLTYHFYDANDNGNAKLRVRSDFGFSGGWPYLGSPPSSGGGIVSGGTYRIVARHSNKVLDVAGCGNADGTNVNQWSWLNNNCQKWTVTNTGSGWRLSPLTAPGHALDVTNCSSDDLANVQIWSWLNNDCQKWDLVDRGGGYYGIRSRASGKYVDILSFSSDDGANAVQWPGTGGTNQQFRFEAVSGSRLAEGQPELAEATARVFPNPTSEQLNIDLGGEMEGSTDYTLYDTAGKVMLSGNFTGRSATVSVKELPVGLYLLKCENQGGTFTEKMQRR
ncbi:family 43 glycosylhydrolase [Roseivirga sp. BDSF3-8]|uniref:family 43 glycosylhydrolase n=1 Tax=Roseivirga sp. BDSF3-8 TaxID=3241598 RepID=UPI0035321CD1